MVPKSSEGGDKKCAQPYERLQDKAVQTELAFVALEKNKHKHRRPSRNIALYRRLCLVNQWAGFTSLAADSLTRQLTGIYISIIRGRINIYLLTYGGATFISGVCKYLWPTSGRSLPLGQSV